MGKEGVEPTRPLRPVVFETTAYTIPPLAQKSLLIIPKKNKIKPALKQSRRVGLILIFKADY